MTRLALRRRTSPKVAIWRYNASYSPRTNVKLDRRGSKNGSKEAVDAVRPRAPSGTARRVGEGGHRRRLRGLHWRRPQTAFPAADQADAMELCDRHPWRVDGGTIPLHAALQVGH